LSNAGEREQLEEPIIPTLATPSWRTLREARRENTHTPQWSDQQRLDSGLYADWCASRLHGHHEAFATTSRFVIDLYSRCRRDDTSGCAYRTGANARGRAGRAVSGHAFPTSSAVSRIEANRQSTPSGRNRAFNCSSSVLASCPNGSVTGILKVEQKDSVPSRHDSRTKTMVASSP
jgi:hypothetical protein